MNVLGHTKEAMTSRRCHTPPLTRLASMSSPADWNTETGSRANSAGVRTATAVPAILACTASTACTDCIAITASTPPFLITRLSPSHPTLTSLTSHLSPSTTHRRPPALSLVRSPSPARRAPIRRRHRLRRGLARLHPLVRQFAHAEHFRPQPSGNLVEQIRHRPIPQPLPRRPTRPPNPPQLPQVVLNHPRKRPDPTPSTSPPTPRHATRPPADLPIHPPSSTPLLLSRYSLLYPHSFLCPHSFLTLAPRPQKVYTIRVSLATPTPNAPRPPVPPPLLHPRLHPPLLSLLTSLPSLLPTPLPSPLPPQPRQNAPRFASRVF